MDRCPLGPQEGFRDHPNWPCRSSMFNKLSSTTTAHRPRTSWPPSRCRRHRMIIDHPDTTAVDDGHREAITVQISRRPTDDVPSSASCCQPPYRGSTSRKYIKMAGARPGHEGLDRSIRRNAKEGVGGWPNGKAGGLTPPGGSIWRDVHGGPCRPRGQMLRTRLRSSSRLFAWPSHQTRLRNRPLQGRRSEPSRGPRAGRVYRWRLPSVSG